MSTASAVVANVNVFLVLSMLACYSSSILIVITILFVIDFVGRSLLLLLAF